MSKGEITPGIAPKRREARHLKISDIVVGTRHRRDMGDVAGLAASIKELGLPKSPSSRPPASSQISVLTPSCALGTIAGAHCLGA